MEPADDAPPVSRENGFETLKSVARDASGVIKALEAMRNEHERLMTLAESESTDGISPPSSPPSAPKGLQQEKVNTFRKSLEKIVLHLDETQVVLLLAGHFQQLEEKAVKLEAQVDRLCDENDWLRTELSVTQQRLNESEVKVSQLEEEKAQLKFMKMTQLDDVSEVGPVRDKSVTNGNGGVAWPQSAKSVDASSREDVTAGNTTDSGKAPVSRQPSIAGVPISEDIPQRLRTLHALVTQYSKQGRFDVAVPLCKQALEDTERSNGFYHMDVATLMNMLALLYRDQGKLEEACDLLHNAVRIKEHCLGSQHMSVASALNNLAVLYSKRGMWAEATPFCKQALTIRETAFGDNHADVAKNLNNIALICQNLGEYSESEAYYKRAIDAYKQLYGPGDGITTRTMNNLAACYLKQMKHEEAKALYAEVLLHTQQVQTGFAPRNDQPVMSPTTAMATGNWQSMCAPTSPVLDGSGTSSQAGKDRKSSEASAIPGEESLPKTFDVTRLVSSSALEDAMHFRNSYSPATPMSPSLGSLSQRGSVDIDSPGSTSSAGTQEPAKRVSSFSRLKGSVGRALGRVIANDKGSVRQRTRSSSLPRQGSDDSDKGTRPNSVFMDNPSRDGSADSPVPGGSVVSPRQQVVLAKPSPIARTSSVQGESASTPLPRRGPLRAYHHGDIKDDAV